jgi:hypothetical protein
LAKEKGPHLAQRKSLVFGQRKSPGSCRGFFFIKWPISCT